MRLQKYMVNEMSMPSWILRIFSKAKNEMERWSYAQFEKKCKLAYKQIKNEVDPKVLSDFLKENGIDEKRLNEAMISEDAKHWWDLIKTEAFPTLAFYPALQVWLEFDKMLKGTAYSGTVISFYAAFWLLLVSGKYVKGWLDWKKTSPEEYDKEKSAGGGGLI